MSEGLFTGEDGADYAAQSIAAAEEHNALPAFTPEQYATLERLTRLQALLAVNEVRLEQVTKWGHTDESDADQPIFWPAKKAQERIGDAVDILRHAGPDSVDKRQRIANARTKLLKGLALGLTAIDRLDAILDQLQKEGN